MVVMLIVMPSALLATGIDDNTQIIALVAIFAALFTIVEYSASSPSLVEFRDAPPFNRVRFSALFATVLCLSVIFRGYETPSAVTDAFQASGTQIGATIDFPYSPVRLMVLMMPPDADPEVVQKLRDAAGLSYLISLISIVSFIIMLRLQHWPRRGGAFNVWVNLPTFDPTAGGDVVQRLQRDGRINTVLGFLLPFLIPAVLKLISLLGTPIRFDNTHTLIWTVTAWAFLPASILMRGVALSRVAQMIHMQRKRAYERAAEDDMQAA
ncbi:hypothetical protein SLH49_03810 [Cognatiyoonia sp. IB215446]|uniref:hypothetical protein n=1 Tax=Cognatiyoonia sp. IB215446 TaxID=3097355 RepID=UPI002A1712CE|nr:hypothetical protein [Cognatiyoonia sp. IB215446]MDX8347104.1 hypothetical protein [Cognatiyoonia sp. IB215446]